MHSDRFINKRPGFTDLEAHQLHTEPTITTAQNHLLKNLLPNHNPELGHRLLNFQ